MSIIAPLQSEVILDHTALTVDSEKGAKPLGAAQWGMRAKSGAIILLATVICATLSLWRFTPDHSHGGGIARVTPALTQLANPFIGIERAERSGIPNAVTWRLLPPVIGNTLRMSPRVYLAIPPAAAFLFLLFSAAYIHRKTANLLITTAGTLLLATSSAFFIATGWVGYFDIFFIAALLGIMVSRRGIWDWAICALAPWCDERFLLMLPACVLMRIALKEPTRNWRRTVFRIILPMALGIAPYIATRFYALMSGSDLTLTYQILHQSEFYSQYLPVAPIGWWMGARLGWVAVAMIPFALGRDRENLVKTAAIFGFIGAVIITLLAWDVSRSAAVVAPFIVISCVTGGKGMAKGVFLLILAVGNLILPAYHVVGDWFGRI